MLRRRFYETWKVAQNRRGVEFYDYEISSLGRVRRRTASYRDPAKRLLKPFPQSTGYLTVNIGEPGHRRTISVHELVCATFHGLAPEHGMVVCHGDGTKQNNNADNLRWGTPRENAADAIAHGQVPRGARHGKGQAKLNLEGVSRIKGLLIGGARTSDLARIFGVSQNTISHIKYERTWREVSARRVRDRQRPVS